MNFTDIQLVQDLINDPRLTLTEETAEIIVDKILAYLEAKLPPSYGEEVFPKILEGENVVFERM